MIYEGHKHDFSHLTNHMKSLNFNDFNNLINHMKSPNFNDFNNSGASVY